MLRANITEGLVDNMRQKRSLLSNVLGDEPAVAGVAASVYTPAQKGWIGVDYRETNGKKHAFNINFLDARYLDLMNIKIVQGRGFSVDNPSDTRRAIVVNQALVDDYGWEDPLGKRLPGQGFIDHEIIGVTENFNYASLRNRVEPLALSITPEILASGIDNISFYSDPAPRITVKIALDQIPSTMDGIEAAWGRVVPDEPFNFTFLDQALDSQYRQEERLSQIVLFGSALAIIIACLGLFGLASLMVARRTKEIGVRKVLVNKEFTKLVVIAFILAVPLAWYIMNRWLADFAYKADITMWVFFGGGDYAACSRTHSQLSIP